MNEQYTLADLGSAAMLSGLMAFANLRHGTWSKRNEVIKLRNTLEQYISDYVEPELDPLLRCALALVNSQLAVLDAETESQKIIDAELKKKEEK
tara:strand:+ start:110 stop:391 length:282 start_codon:yes stop_codon:yes gene_type:complete